MAAADTFRAAAIEQLTEWSNRAGVDIIAQQEGSDPAAVIMMPARQQSQDMQMFFYAILPDVFIIRRTL